MIRVLMFYSVRQMCCLKLYNIIEKYLNKKLPINYNVLKFFGHSCIGTLDDEIKKCITSLKKFLKN